MTTPPPLTSPACCEDEWPCNLQRLGVAGSGLQVGSVSAPKGEIA
jgi:hypothetical protein